jgi:radical SAM protein with 4Fe4S-binding SPASM domain
MTHSAGTPYDVNDTIRQGAAAPTLRLTQSRFLRAIPARTTDRTFVYHTLFGNPRILNNEGMRLLGLFQHSTSLNTLQAAVDGDVAHLITDLHHAHFLVPDTTDERAIVEQRRNTLLEHLQTGNTIDHISLSVSDNCNFTCNHCMLYQPDTHGRPLDTYRRPASLLNMTWNTAHACIDSYLHHLRDRNQSHARIHFGNAEPLLNWSVIATTLNYCATKTAFTFDFAINTNLSLLTPQMAHMLKRFNVKIATSLDGIGLANDLIRTRGAGKGTFDLILEKLDLLATIGFPVDGFSITITNRNFHAVDTEIIYFAANRGMESLALDFDLTNVTGIGVDERVDKILRLKTAANSNGIYFGGTWYSPFRKLLTVSLADQPHAFCAAVEGRALVFNPDGTIKTCGYTTTRVGHLHRLPHTFTPTGGLYYLVANRFPGTDTECHDCALEGPCGGQCQATREAASRKANGLLEYMCTFYRAMTDALIQDYVDVAHDPTAIQQRTQFI